MVTLLPITPAAVARFKATRLQALLDTPTAFGSTYAKECQLSDADWARRAAQWDGDLIAGYLASDGTDAGEVAAGIAAGWIDEADPTRATLFSMWVNPSHRGGGVGRLLVDRVAEWARSRGCDRLQLMVTSSNAGAMRFYERLGFVRTGRTAPYPNDPALFEHEMSRGI